MTAILLPNGAESVESLKRFESAALVVFDIDGTLAESANQVADLIGTFARSLVRQGVRTTVATGRAINGARPVVQKLPENPLPMATYNGAVISDRKGREIYDLTSISREAVTRICELARRSRATLWLYQVSLRSTTGAGALETVYAYAPSDGPPVELNGLRVSWNAPENIVLQEGANTVAALLRAIDTNAQAKLVRLLQTVDGVSATTSGGGYIELRPLGISKATALRSITKRLGLTSDRVIAVGDNQNDTEMLEWAGLGVVVANASTEAREAADFITRRPAGSGVLELLNAISASRRYAR